jgi:hypothetical protein
MKQKGEHPQTNLECFVPFCGAARPSCEREHILLVSTQADERKWGGRTCTLVTAVCASDANSSTASTASETKDEARIAKEEGREGGESNTRVSLSDGSHTSTHRSERALVWFCLRVCVRALCRSVGPR